MALRPEFLDILSICTGGGGLDLGVGLALPGARVVCMVEREAFAVAHLVQAMREGLLHPAPVWSDARTFDGRAWRGCLDGLVGGIPCQPHSLAGKRLAELDERDLWSTARRIIVQARPWFVLIENVAGMLSSGGGERAWRDLGRLGYACEIGLFTAAEVGAPHKRERLFILAVHDGLSALADAGCSEWRPLAGRGRDPDGADAGRPEGAGRVAESSPNVADAGQRRVQRFGGAGELLWPPGAPEGEGCERQRHGHDLGDGVEGLSGRELADADLAELRREPSAGQLPVDEPDAGTARGSLFPPGPHDREAWKAVLDRAPELEPAFRRVADGLAARLDLAVDRLRLLGNGVVPLEAGFALRTLASRLAARSMGAARLLRMMEAA